MLEGQQRQAACNRCKTLWAALSMDWCQVWSVSLVLATFLSVYILMYTLAIRTEVRQWGSLNGLWRIWDGCLDSQTKPLQWWQIQNSRSCIISPDACPWRPGRLRLSSGVFNHCFNPQPVSVSSCCLVYLHISHWLSNYLWWSLIITLPVIPSLHAPYQDTAGYQPIRALFGDVGPIRGQETVSMVILSYTGNNWARKMMLHEYVNVNAPFSHAHQALKEI